MRLSLTSKIGIGTLINIGFAIAIVLTLIIGAFSIYNLRKMSTNFEAMSMDSIEVSSELGKLKSASMSGAVEANRLKDEMNNRLIKMLGKNASDMQNLQQTFLSLDSLIMGIVESGEKDATLLLLELEDIQATLQGEWIPQVKEIAGEIANTAAEGKAMAETVSRLGVNLTGFVDLAEKGSSLSDGIKESATGSVSEAKNSIKIMIAVLLLSLLGVFVMAIITKRGIIRPIKKVTDRIRDIAEGEGDLTKRLEINVQDELGDLSTWFNAFVEKLENIISNLTDNSRTLADSSQQLSAVSIQIASGTRDQTSRASQVATATQELSATIIEVAKNAASAAEAARKANEKASDGGMIVHKTIDSIKGISETAKESSKVITSLGERSEEIGNIIMVIEDIADQTNLLALNAAIEAARAGEQGRGFAVVADEVRKLAERTSKATKEIGAMIKAIQNETAKAIDTTNREIKAVGEGVMFAEEAGESMGEILSQVESVNTVIDQIAVACEEQSVAADQISSDIEAVSKISDETSTGAAHIASLSSEIDGLANSLKSTTGKFKVSQSAASVESVKRVELVEEVHMLEPPAVAEEDKDKNVGESLLGS